MKLLAKSIVDEAQIGARSDISKDGIEFLLFGNDIFGENLGTTIKKIQTAHDSYGYPVIGIEAPDSDNLHELNINPISSNKQLEYSSRIFLERGILIANEVAQSTKATVYFQYQCLFDKYHNEKKPRIINRDSALGKLKEFHEKLQRNSDVPLQIENVIPVDPAYGSQSMHHCFITTRMSDFAQMDVPIAFDIVHYAQSMYAWSKAQQENEDWWSLRAEGQKFYLQMTEEDVELGKSLKGKELKPAITAQIVKQTAELGSRIGSLQFSDSKIGFGTSQNEAGYDGENGMIDVAQVIEAANRANVPYIIPEYKEEDYNCPVIQRKIFKELQR